MDYQKELERLESSGNYWKPKADQYDIESLSELEDAEPFVKKREGQPDEVHQQARIKILVNDEEKIWTFGKGATLASSYGQLIKLASSHNNQLTGLKFKVVVKNDGTKNDYTIVQ